MSNRRPYPGASAAGRQHNSTSALDQINESLAALEERLHRSRADMPLRKSGPDRERILRQSNAGPDADLERNYGLERNYQALMQDIERARSQEDGLATAGRIAGELQGLRNDLRQQMTKGLQREFEVLRQDIDHAFHSGKGADESVRLGRELERLSSTVQDLAHKNDDRGIGLMRLELEQLRARIETLASEESVQAVGRRWEEFDRRWSAFEHRFEAGKDQQHSEPALALLNQRLEEIARAVDILPQSLSQPSLEKKLHALALAVDQIASRCSAPQDMLGLIDERLDEISRAIVASTVAAQANSFDATVLERIEDRIAALAGQIEEVAQDRQQAEIMERLTLLSERVDEMAVESHLPEDVLVRFADQIAAIADRVDQAPQLPDLGPLLEGLEQRFDLFAASMDRRQSEAVEQGNIIFRDLERRLDDVAQRLDRSEAIPAFDPAEVIEAIDARFAALTRELDDREPAGQQAIAGLEMRLAGISQQLDDSAERFGGIDPELIRSLEAQVAGLSAHLSMPGAPLPDFEDISPRLSQIEQSLAGTRETVLEAAREATERAVQAIVAEGAGGGHEHAAVAGLAQDLKTLEALTRRSDDRNARTFEAIHDTLLKIVDRLGSLETVKASQETPEQAPKIALDTAPEPGVEVLAEEGKTLLDHAMDAQVPSPAPAKAADDESTRKNSLFGGFSRAFRKEAALKPEEALKAHESVEPELDEPLEPLLVNTPLEPGSGTPDLNAILKRVRDERGVADMPATGDAARSDFIAAARRAAQAAATEAATLNREPGPDDTGKAARMSDGLKARRKPVLMAAGAIVLALAGLQFGKSYLAGGEQVSTVAHAPVTVEQAIAEEKSAEAVEAPLAEPTRIVEPVRLSDAQVAPAVQDKTPVTDALPETGLSENSQPDDLSVQAEVAGLAAPDEAELADAALTDTVSTAAISPVSLPVSPLLHDIPVSVGTPVLREAAAAGDAKALFEIGAHYAEGRGVSEDLSAAAQWYEQAAELGLAPAQYRIGNFYEKGTGVARDIGKARKWYEMAAKQGNASAMHNLAVLLTMGTDGAADNAGAVRWFKAAADLGVKDSQFNLGILAAKGVGMAQNLEDSYKWFSLVAKTGDKDAASKRDEIARALRPEQLEKARQTAELWEARELDLDANGVTIPDAWVGEPVTTASVDMKKAVRNIQAILNKNGYAAGAIDGAMGDKTRQAIAAFQADNGLPATGEVDEKLIEALLAKN
ncbi:peptidoglycan-binding protein [Aquamicrobium segne]|uniref:Peptidoglycan-binding protein n=1 Tax=Aquamicrobium segne TaxID=469547 RepID=A0ABW0GW53_9HYPH